MLRIILASILCFQAATSSAGILSVLGTNEEAVRERRAVTGLNYDPNCDSKYKSIDASHSMCLIDVGTKAVLTQADKDAIVKAHNDYRSAVSPTATNMQKMVWDEEMATIAAKWASQCQVAHDTYSARKTISLPNITIGQNAAGGYSNFAAAIEGWHSEVNDYELGTGSINGNDVGHYTQVVHHRSARVGCGQADCNGSNVYVCNYAIGQNSYKTPYTAGESCSACSDKCVNNQCDCGGKLCYNSGELDVSTCTCTCPTIYTGDQCETLSCNYNQKSWCSGKNATDCTKYSNYPTDCHMLCGLCPYPCNGKKCENGGALNVQTCSCTCQFPYAGPTCTEKNCTKLDKYWCAQQDPAKCTVYSNYPTDCSIMCGICPKPCDGKECLNGGTLNFPASCNCNCVEPYSGDTCETATCNPDQSWCSAVSASDCSEYNYYKQNCGFHCNICQAA